MHVLGVKLTNDMIIITKQVRKAPKPLRKAKLNLNNVFSRLQRGIDGQVYYEK